MHESAHQSITDTTRDGEGDHPRQDDVAEEWPVDVLARAEATDEDDRADLAVSGRDWQTDVRRDQHRQGWPDLNAKTTAQKCKKTSCVLNVELWLSFEVLSLRTWKVWF